MTQFSDFGLLPSLEKAVADLNFTNPMPVQEQVIPILLSQNTNMMALAQTGTGKTAAFGLPILHKCDMSNLHTEALILSPTRELCVQIAKDLERFAKYIPGLRIAAVYGGASIDKQLGDLARGVKIVVATPGRMLDIIRRKKIDFSHLHTVVFDEADEMLQMGFKDELDGILAETPDNKNTWLFSATMPKEIRGLTKKYMSDPIEITVGNRNEGSANITHHYYVVHARDRYRALKRIIDYYPDIYSIIFCRTRRETQEVAELLIKDGYNADALHGDLSQAQRDNAMSRFRLKNLQLLVATDVAARGLDVNNLTHVLNYNLPDDIEQYTHRSGRTGRASRTGISISVVNLREKGRIKDIEKQIRKSFEKKQIPSGREICEKQLFGVVNRMENADISSSEIDPYLPQIYTQWEQMPKEELIKRFVALEFNRFLEYYQNATDLEDVDNPSREKSSRSESGRGYSKLFINVGRIDGVMPQNLIGLVNDYFKDRDLKIGRIEILKTFSFIEIDEKFADPVVEALKKAVYQDRKVFAEISKDAPRRSSERSGGGRSGERSGGSRSGERSGGSRSGERSGGSRSGGSRSGERSSGSRSGERSSGSRSGERSSGSRSGERSSGSRSGERSSSRGDSRSWDTKERKTRK